MVQKMNEENKIGYYAIIPSTILFNENIKANEKLLYAIITVLSNKEGYCFASNSYLGDLLNVKAHTISIWVSELKNMGFVHVDIIKNEKGEVIQRRIYPNDTPYVINKTYPYVMKKTQGMSQKGQYNNININKIDILFNYIINDEQEVPKEFEDVGTDKIINLLEKYDMLYNKKIIEIFNDENLEKIKHVTYIIALMAKDNLEHLSKKISRDKLLKIYDDCKAKEKAYNASESKINDFTSYYYKSVVNELLKPKKPFFNANKTKEGEDEDEEECEY